MRKYKGNENIRQRNEKGKRIEEKENRLVQQGARRSERLANKNQQANISTVTKEETIPKSFEEAINGESAQKWRKAMEREIRSLDDHKTWDLIHDLDIEEVKLHLLCACLKMEKHPMDGLRRAITTLRCVQNSNWMNIETILGYML
ncbi:hypothetical protein KM043_009726 [Ampulex compressa]|nr:hypothetical protein KM043_009726 [Ampulex compressa]